MKPRTYALPLAEGPAGMPRILYKYQPFSGLSLENLVGPDIWFSKPTAFNDPFDCGVRPGVYSMDEAFEEAVYQRYRAKAENREAFDARWNDENPDYKNWTLLAFSLEVNAEPEERRKLRVACFSETPLDPLMWSHYADGHKGFCVGYSTRFPPLHRAEPVRYSDLIPTTSPPWRGGRDGR